MSYYSNEKIKEKYEIIERDYLFWGAFTLEGLELLSKLNLTSIQFKILLFLCSQIEQKDNIAYVRQKNISKELKIDKSNLSRSTKVLRIKNLIAKVQNGYMINPNLFYLGKKDGHQLHSLHQKFGEKMDADSIYDEADPKKLEELLKERLPFEYPEI